MTGSDTLLIGADGMLGRCWRRWAETARELRVGFVGLEGCDISDAAAVERVVLPGMRTVINSAAYTNVDGAEAEEVAATAVNGTAVGILAARCREVGATLVHYSTDYVFDGLATAPYGLNDKRRPVNAYGRSKAVGEELLEASGCDFLLLRTSWLYAAHGNNFVRTIAKLAGERESLRVVSDQMGRPTCADQLVLTTMGMLRAGARGVHHATDAGQCSWHEFATAIAARTNPMCRVDPCSSSEFPRPAKRPAYSVLDIRETERLAGPLAHWRTTLEQTLNRLQMTAASVPGGAST